MTENPEALPELEERARLSLEHEEWRCLLAGLRGTKWEQSLSAAERRDGHLVRIEIARDELDALWDVTSGLIDEIGTRAALEAQRARFEIELLENVQRTVGAALVRSE